MFDRSFPTYTLTTVGWRFIPAFFTCKLAIPIGVGVSSRTEWHEQLLNQSSTPGSEYALNMRFIILLLWCPGGRVCLERFRPRRIEA